MADRSHIWKTRGVLVFGFASFILACLGAVFVYSWGLLLAIPALLLAISGLLLWLRIPTPRERLVSTSAALAGVVMAAALGAGGVAVLGRVRQASTERSRPETSVEVLAGKLDCQKVVRVEPPRGPAAQEVECSVNGMSVVLATFVSENARDAWVALGRSRGLRNQVVGQDWAALTSSASMAAKVESVLGG